MREKLSERCQRRGKAGHRGGVKAGHCSAQFDMERSSPPRRAGRADQVSRISPVSGSTVRPASWAS
jgi:hypothetical protein